MKNTKQNILGMLLLASCSLIPTGSFAQDDTAAVPVVKLHYYNNNNSVQYLILDSKMKKEMVFSPQVNKTYQIYLDSAVEANLIANVKTDDKGKAKAFLPITLQAAWAAKPSHTFIVKAGEEEVISDYHITKAKITLDTVNTDGTRSLTVTVTKFDGTKWVPVKDVELKMGSERLGSILGAGDEATYTTDSLGTVTAEFKKVNLPGNEKGNLTLAARVDDNEELGNLLVEQTAAWGKPTAISNNFFNQRTLWTTRFKTPYWLLILAYGIVFSVWGTLLYLISQIIKIKKLGTNSKP